MDLDSAKKRFDAQFLKAIHSKSEAVRLHPVRIIQALKSLVGIDISNPSENLLIWGEEYMKDKPCFPSDKFIYKINKPSETIVLSNLGTCIRNKNKDSCKKELQDLCLVSDGSQLFEYLLEFSAFNKISSISFIWSAYRSNLFLNNKYSYPLLLISIDKLINPFNEKENSLSSFEHTCVIESIRNNILTRANRIKGALKAVDFKSDFFNKTYLTKHISILEKGRIGILNYINELDLEDITPDLILFLDACRMVLKDSSYLNHSKIENSLNYVIDKKIYD